MSNYCAWASGSPTITSNRGRSSVRCCRWAPNSSGPSATASPKRTTGVAPRGHVGIIRAFPRNLLEDQLAGFRVLDYLAERESTPEQSLRSATRASKALLSGMVRKKWIIRDDLSEARDAVRNRVKMGLEKR